MRLRARGLGELTIEEAATFRKVALWRALERVLRDGGYGFRVPERAVGWDRVVFLNLTYWTAAGEGDLLPARRIPADVVAHVAWHALARRALPRPTADAMLLGESIASAFDAYLVGRLLALAPRSRFLETQVEAMAAAARGAGLSRRGFERLLAGMAERPAAAFESLRGLLAGAAFALVRCPDLDAAAAALERLDAHPMAPLLHHFELSNWILHARAYGDLAPDPGARAIDAALRAAPDALAWLEERWVWRLSQPGATKPQKPRKNV